MRERLILKSFLASLALDLVEIFRPVLLAVLTWASWKFVAYVKAHTKHQQAQTSLLVLNDAVATAVESLEQTVVKKLRGQAEGGKLNADSAAVVRAAAVDRVKLNLGAVELARAMSVFGISSSAMDTVLGSKVEAHVLRLPKVKMVRE